MMTTRSIAGCFAVTLAISCTAPTYDTAPPFAGDPPAVYVAKVKNILIGVPATDADIAAVTADPEALAGLIDTWMTEAPYSELYQQKMQVFFELAFQQTQISVADFVNTIPNVGLGNGISPPLLVQNIRESFARTVVAMTMNDEPLTHAFTTKQLMMTPALMSLYAYLEMRRADDNAKIADTWRPAHQNKLTMTIEASAGPITLADSLNPKSKNYLTFYNPDLLTQKYADPSCNGLDPITVTANSQNMWDMLFGVIPPHASPTAFECPVRGGVGSGIIFKPTDFTTWNLVTIAPPAAGEPITPFEDVTALEATPALALATPRPGFFSTPAFGANWPTNDSNQMRVTLNQALIVATGTAIDGTDPTIPSTTPGLDPVHAVPGSACVGCHQLLDPTRSILSATYSWYYNPQTDAALIAQPGLFAFQGVIAPMATIDDFANLLATHPLVAQAWAEKLCYYVNSAPCATDDPVFKAIVADFAKGFSWNTLVKELLSSPIVTNASDTRTHDTAGEVIAVSRRDHLCAALNNRLGFVDICQLDESDRLGKPLTTIAQIVSGMPSDGYGRGSTIPVLPNQPTLFYRSGLENVCSAVSELVVDATANADQPGAKQWSSAHPDTAIADFVSTLLSFTPSDPRSAPAVAALTSHFQTAMAAPLNASATDALRSTFVTACLSPSFIGIGM